MGYLKSLLPTRTEARKLFLEIWKYLLLALLGAVAVFVPAVRAWVVARSKDIWTFGQRDILVRGWFIILSALCALFAIAQLLRWIGGLFRGAHIRGFTQAHFDGIDWIWRWKKGRVNRLSMTPLCPKCQTELILTPRTNAHDGVVTTIFCTRCNSGFAINVSDLREHISHKIEGDVRSKRWKEHISKTTNEA
jgi:hypothetical protein